MIKNVLILSGILYSCHCACVYPSDLIGDWYSTSFGTLTFTDQSFSGFTSVLSAAPLTFTCYESSGSIYVSRSSHSLFSNVAVELYLCMDLQRISSFKYIYTLNSNRDGTGIRFYSTSTAGAVTMSEVCSYTDTRSPGEYELLIKTDQISNAVINCPDGLQTTLDVTMTTRSVSDCTGTQLIGSNGHLNFSYSSCVTGVFNTGGQLQCVYSKTSGYKYVTLYNQDSNTDGSTTFKFSCLTYTKPGATLRATESSSACHTDQTPTSVESPGITYVMTDRLYTPPEETDEKDYTVIIIVCCVLGAVIIIVIIIIVLYLKVFRKPRPPTPEPPKIRKKRRKPSVIDYSPRVLNRSSSIEKTDELPSKMSAEEILSGVTVENRQSNLSIDNLNAYEPPKKEVWQKKWESDLRPKTPRLSSELLKNSRSAFPSVDLLSEGNDMSVMELDKAFTMSTSLPESLDYHSAQSSYKQPLRHTKDFGGSSSETINSIETPRYTERSHAASKIPESTGKFGGPPKMPSMDSVIMPKLDSRLGTITENPLSRENTTIPESQKDDRLKRLQQHLLRMKNSEFSAISTPVAASDGTASGWQYKWETVLRPKSGQSDVRRKRRSHSPANLFQNANLQQKESKWKLLKAKFQNKFRGNKVNNLETTEVEKVEDKMDTESAVTVASLKIENETDEGTKSAEGEVSSYTEDGVQSAGSERTIQKRRQNIRRRDSLELLRESMNHLHSTATTPDLHTSTTNSVNSINEIGGEDGRVSVNSVDKANETDKTVDADSDMKALFLKPKNIGVIKDTHYDAVSIHTELFYPDEWIYESCVGLNELWDLCSKTTASIRRREYKQYIKCNGEEEYTLKKDKRKRERHTFKTLDEQKLDSAK